MTDVLIILDESGSMSSKYEETCVAFDQYVNGVREDQSVEHVHLVTFNSRHVNKLYDGERIDAVLSLNKDNYNPDGETPLYDAVGNTLNDMIGGAMFVVIITDGQENSSREYNRDSVQALIAERENLGWDFIFLGADIDAWGDAGRHLGLTRGKTLSFSGAAMASGMAAARTATADYNTGGRLADDYFEGDDPGEDFAAYLTDDS
jgi:hypothetical protein